MKAKSVWLLAMITVACTMIQCSDPDEGDENNAAGNNGNNSIATCEISSEKYLSAEEVYTTINSGCGPLLLLNVMPADMYSGGHIDGSVDISWDELEGRLDEISKDQTIILYCKGGMYSETAYNTLADAEYPSIWVLQGGLNAWESAGYEVVPVEGP